MTFLNLASIISVLCWLRGCESLFLGGIVQNYDIALDRCCIQLLAMNFFNCKIYYFPSANSSAAQSLTSLGRFCFLLGFFCCRGFFLSLHSISSLELRGASEAVLGEFMGCNTNFSLSFFCDFFGHRGFQNSHTANSSHHC